MAHGISTMAVKDVIRVYEFSTFRLDPAERLLLREGERVPLSPKAFSALVLLVENSGRVVSKEEFLEKIWPDAFVEEGSLTVVVSLIRKALGESREGPKYIETVSKHGYRFRADVSRVTGEGEMRAPLIAQGVASPSATKHEAALRSIAVLPFNALGARQPDQFLQMGLADAIITRLSNIRQFVVRPTSAVTRYETDRTDGLTAGRELGVDCVLDGYVRRTDDRIRVTVQLIRTCDGSPVWAERFDEEFTDILTVEDSISERVAVTLLEHLTSDEKTRLTKHSTENNEAHQAWLKGRYFWNRRTDKEILRAAEHFEQALELDPGFALAWVGLADACALYSTYGVAAPRQSYPQAEAAALRALELDGQLAEAHTTLGLIRYEYDWDWARAEAEFQRALDLKPNYANAHHWFAGLLISQGRFAEGLQAIRRAQELDPLSLIIHARAGWFCYLARQYDVALQEVTKSLEIDHNFGISYVLLALIYERMGWTGAATEAARTALQLMGDTSLSLVVLIYVLNVAGRRAEAQELMQRLERLAGTQYLSAYKRALICASLEDHEGALAWLDEAVEARDQWLVWLNVEPKFDALRADPRFARLLERVGLTAG